VKQLLFSHKECDRRSKSTVSSPLQRAILSFAHEILRRILRLLFAATCSLKLGLYRRFCSWIWPTVTDSADGAVELSDSQRGRTIITTDQCDRYDEQASRPMHEASRVAIIDTVTRTLFMPPMQGPTSCRNNTADGNVYAIR